MIIWMLSDKSKVENNVLGSVPEILTKRLAEFATKETIKTVQFL